MSRACPSSPRALATLSQQPPGPLLVTVTKMTAACAAELCWKPALGGARPGHVSLTPSNPVKQVLLFSPSHQGRPLGLREAKQLALRHTASQGQSGSQPWAGTTPEGLNTSQGMCEAQASATNSEPEGSTANLRSGLRGSRGPPGNRPSFREGTRRRSGQTPAESEKDTRVCTHPRARGLPFGCGWDTSGHLSVRRVTASGGRGARSSPHVGLTSCHL